MLLKRKIIIEDKKLINVHESYNSIENFNQQTQIIADEFLFKILKKQRQDATVSDIVPSIQYNQFQIIAAPKEENMIIQGCAGCGKTMVLFHRLKYIVGNNLLNSSDICVLTPSERFNEFIKPLLSDLKLPSIRRYDITQYYCKVIDEYLPKQERAYKLSDLFKTNNWLDCLPIEILSDSDLPENIVSQFYSKKFFDSVMATKEITIRPLRKVTFIKQNEKTDNSTKREFKSRIADEEGHIDIIGALLGEKELELLPEYQRQFGKIHKCELFALCLFYFRRCGKFTYNEDGKNNNDYTFLFRLTMIDEAQDLSLQEIQFIKSLNGINSRINLFGDIKQCLHEHGIKDWNSAAVVADKINQYNLDINYRNTSEIITYVNNLCKTNMKDIGYNGFSVVEIGLDELDNSFNEQKSAKRKAIICAEEAKQTIKSLYPALDKYIYSTDEVKGMEFDCVFAFTEKMTQNEKYVSLTRALDKLHIVV